MRRREFIAAVGYAAGFWPLVVRAQPARVYRVGVLLVGNADAESFQTQMRDGLGKSGYVEKQNLQFDFRSADGKLDLLAGLAAELVALKVDVIVAFLTPCALAAQKATKEIPIVVVSGDPVGTGLVTSVARPGGNITGISLMGAEMHGKCVELFRDIFPSVRRVGVLLNAADPFSKQIREQVLLAGRTTGIEIAPPAMVHGRDEIDAAFAVMKKGGAGAVVVQGSLTTKDVADLALKHGLPAGAQTRSFAEVGGLISYGADGPEVFRQSTRFVVKILQGGNPTDMPVEQPTKFELVVNLKAAKALGITIPESFLLRADQVIE
jgi:putative ABC transport system substrate-binding protein